jgi:hypothetical protein
MKKTSDQLSVEIHECHVFVMQHDIVHVFKLNDQHGRLPYLGQGRPTTQAQGPLLHQ